MLLEDRKDIKFQNKTYLKILYLSSAYKNTYVFLGMESQSRDILVHCDVQGKILCEYRFQNSIDSFGMTNEKEVIILETRKDQIAIVDLEKAQIQYLPHHFFAEESDQSQILTFADSRLVCVQESGRYNDHRFKLTYYEYPLKSDSKAVAVYESKEDEWTYEHIVRKGNSHSMVIWFKNRHDQQFQFKTFDLRDDPKGRYNHYKIKNSIGEAYQLSKVECAVCNVWEQKPGKLLAVCVSNKCQAKAINSEGVVNNNFIIDLAEGRVTEAKFTFDIKYNDYQIDYMNIGNISMFRTFYFTDGKAQSSPVYYINNETESIVASQTWHCSYKTKYFIPSFDNSTLIEGEYENGDVSEFTIKIKKIMDPKQISLHFLLNINEQFDDDLLQDAIDLLGYI